MSQVRISGKDFKEFHEKVWPTNYAWADDSTYTPDGATQPVEIYGGDGDIIIKDDEIFTVPDYWCIFDEVGDAADLDLRVLLAEWLSKKENDTVVISIPKGKEAELQKFLESVNGKQVV